MAQINQLAGTYVLDIPCHNYSSSVDLAANVAVILDTSNTGGTGTNPAPGVTLPASNAKPFGFTVSKIPFGKTGLVRVYGVAVATASGTIHVGDILMTDSAGAVLPQTTGLAQIGLALSEAVSTDTVLVLIDRAKNA